MVWLCTIWSSWMEMIVQSELVAVAVAPDQGPKTDWTEPLIWTGCIQFGPVFGSWGCSLNWLWLWLHLIKAQKPDWTGLLNPKYDWAHCLAGKLLQVSPVPFHHKNPWGEHWGPEKCTTLCSSLLPFPLGISTQQSAPFSQAWQLRISWPWYLTISSLEWCNHGMITTVPILYHI